MTTPHDAETPPAGTPPPPSSRPAAAADDDDPIIAAPGAPPIESLGAVLPPDPGASFVPGRSLSQTGPTLARPHLPDDPISHGAATPHWSITAERARATASAPAPRQPYIFRRLAGKGGFGEVWEAVQVNLGRVVAIKRMRADLDQEDGVEKAAARREEFELEAVTTARLDHPNIVPVYDFGQDEQGRLMLAMKLASGTGWDVLVKKEIGELPPAEFLAKHLPILVANAQAVAFAHARGIVHRDLKPAQVIVGEFGEVMLMDWGLAVLFDPERLGPEREIEAVQRLPTPANASNPAGTPVVMAPEQVRFDAKLIGPWTDVYLLGATLYYLLTGSYPHDAASSMDAMKKAMIGKVEPPAERAPGREMPPELVALAMKAMERKPKDRLPSAKAFIAGIEDYLSGASRRREAEEITREVARRLDAPSLDYAALNVLAQRLTRARELFPSLPAIRPLHERVQKTFARRALDLGDLTLARTQALALEEGSERDALVAEIDRAAAEAERIARQRRQALRAIAVLVVLIIGGTSLFTWRINEAKNRAIAAEQETNRRRIQAENLFRFALSELHPILERERKLDLLKAIADNAIRYYEEENVETVDRVGGQRLFESISLIGSVYEGQGNLEGAFRANRLAAEKALQMSRRFPDDTAWTAEQLQAQKDSQRLIRMIQSAPPAERRMLEQMLKGFEDSHGFAAPTTP